MTKPVTKVSDLVLDELSLVDRPANVKSRSVLYKRDDAGEGTFLQRLKARLFKESATTFDDVRSKHELYPMLEALSASLRSILCDDDVDASERMDLLDQTLKEFRDELASLPAFVTKADDGEDESSRQRNNSQEDGMKTLEDAMAKIAELEKELAGYRKGGDMKKSDELDFVIKLAEVDPEAAEQLEKSLARTTELEKRLAAAEAREIARERLTKAATIARKVPVEHGKLANVLAKLDDTDVEVLDGVFKAASEATEHLKLYKELGDVVDVTDGADALQAAVTKLRDANPKLSHEQAVAKALEANPALYDLVTADTE